ncbi:hypothetical protein HDU98_008685 [Podochytrium sp. JEL0797]|nr:hypothetical protein HDU98_008685 [Podochytrium sp. JEL0797]
MSHRVSQLRDEETSSSDSEFSNAVDSNPSYPATGASPAGVVHHAAAAPKPKSGHHIKALFLQQVLLHLALQYLGAYLLSFVFGAIVPGSSWITSKLLAIGGLVFSQTLSDKREDAEDNRNFLIAYTIYQTYACTYSATLLSLTPTLQTALSLAIHWFFGISLFTHQHNAKWVGHAPAMFGAAVVVAMVVMEGGSVLSVCLAGYFWANTVIGFEAGGKGGEVGVWEKVVEWNLWMVPLVNADSVEEDFHVWGAPVSNSGIANEDGCGTVRPEGEDRGISDEEAGLRYPICIIPQMRF